MKKEVHAETSFFILLVRAGTWAEFDIYIQSEYNIINLDMHLQTVG